LKFGEAVAAALALVVVEQDGPADQDLMQENLLLVYLKDKHLQSVQQDLHTVLKVIVVDAEAFRVM
jgi:hypothetical protein